jgi:hypothetical protein
MAAFLATARVSSEPNLLLQFSMADLALEDGGTEGGEPGGSGMVNSNRSR